MLDDTQRDDDSNDPIKLGYGPGSYGYGHGSLDSERYNWLVSELDKGQAEGKLMIIAAHEPIGVETAPSMMAWIPTAEAELIAKLHTYPNLLLWIAGHRHLNTVTAFKSPDANRPELGFWQVETSSLREFPQQFRTFEIVRNSDQTISILTTNVDPAVKDGSFAAISRSYAIAAQQIFKVPLNLLPTGSYNAELVKPLSPEMQAKLKQESLVSFVKSAVAYAKTNDKEKALAEFSNPNGSFVQGELYIYAYDFNGTTLAHPFNPEKIGLNRLNEKDAQGGLFIKNLIDAVKNGSGFSRFYYINPAHHRAVESKLGYVKKVDDDWWLGSGIYEGPVDPVTKVPLNS